jgi:disulfide bond formation protein DsbB
MWYLAAVACCAALMGFALYVQHRLFLDPCPLCIFQRLAFVWIGLWALVGAIHYPSGRGRWIYSWLIMLGAVAGSLVSGRHVWLQNLPPGEVPECGPGLSYLMETAPFLDVLKTVLLGDGNCAEVQWTFLGFSMPVWTMVWFIGLGLATLWFTVSSNRSDKAQT